MCRNIRPLFNFEPPASDEEVIAAAEQFVRKLSGFTKPSKANEAVFNRAIADTAKVARQLIRNLVTDAQSKNREEEAEKRRQKSLQRFGPRTVSKRAATATRHAKARSQ